MDYLLVNNGFVWVIYGQVWVIESMLIGNKVELVVYQVEVYEKNCWIINCFNFEGYKVMEKVGQICFVDKEFGVVVYVECKVVICMKGKELQYIIDLRLEVISCYFDIKEQEVKQFLVQYS